MLDIFGITPPCLMTAAVPSRRAAWMASISSPSWLLYRQWMSQPANTAFLRRSLPTSSRVS